MTKIQYTLTGIKRPGSQRIEYNVSDINYYDGNVLLTRKDTPRNVDEFKSSIESILNKERTGKIKIKVIEEF